MEFGKLPDISQVNFALPPDPPGNGDVFNRLGKTNHAELRHSHFAYIGATGWGMKEWVGKVYPKDAGAKDFLYHYTRQFNTIELNTTHYRIPDAATVAKWYGQAAADFKFCPKVLQTISHSSDLGLGNSLTSQFCEAISGLQDKLGCCFIQLPPYFGADRLGALEGFLKNFSLPLAVEVRHTSWFDHPKHFEDLFALLEAYDASPVITDVAGRRDVCHMRLTNGTLLVRFVGNDLHPSDFTRLDDWAARLGEWFDKGLSTVYFFTHEPDNLLAPDLAIYLFEKLSKKEGISTRAPRLIGWVPPGGQMSLF
jgi:uncharacterized protein YecE (DUF72 family)